MGYDIPRYFWIDAVCINQSDLPERGSQVSMMDVIYRHATNVLVWLGELDIFIRPAAEAMNALLDLEKTMESRESLRSIDITVDGELKKSSPKFERDKPGGLFGTIRFDVPAVVLPELDRPRGCFSSSNLLSMWTN